MQCRYRERLIIAGDWIFGEVHPEWRPAGKRRGKFRATSEMQARLNERRSALQMTALAHENFGKTDYNLNLTFRDGCCPADRDELERVIRNFVARIRRIYRRAGIELRYIIERGFSGMGRPHAHIYLTGGIPREEIEAAWGLGYANCRGLEFTETGITDLSAYIAGQKREGKTDAEHVRMKGERRWTGSRNLRRPVERTNVSRYSREAMEEIADAGNPHSFFARRYPGYWLAEFPDVRQNPVTHGWECTFMLYRPDSAQLASYARRERRRGV